MGPKVLKEVLDRSPRHETQNRFGPSQDPLRQRGACPFEYFLWVTQDQYGLLKHLPTAVNLLQTCSHQNSHPTTSNYASKKLRNLDTSPNLPNWSRSYVLTEVTKFDKSNRLQGVVVVSTQGCRTLIKIKSCAFNLFRCFFFLSKKNNGTNNSRGIHY